LNNKITAPINARMTTKKLFSCSIMQLMAWIDINLRLGPPFFIKWRRYGVA